MANFHLFYISDLFPVANHWHVTLEFFKAIFGSNLYVASASPICLCVMKVLATVFILSLVSSDASWVRTELIRSIRPESAFA